MILVPRTASEITGKSVPHKTAKHMTIKTTLLNKKPLSRDENDSILFLERNNCMRCDMRPKETTKMKKTKPRKMGPSDEAVNECTDDIIPLRVRKVPKIQSVKVIMIKTIFHTLSMSFFSWIMTEWSNAVPASQGMKDAFSTGSHAQ